MGYNKNPLVCGTDSNYTKGCRCSLCRRAHADAAISYTKRNPARRLHAKLRTDYGLSLDEYEAMRVAQGGVCAACGQSPKGRLDVDHCHETGKVRGLLCNGCNGALGRLQDDPERVVALLAYCRGWD